MPTRKIRDIDPCDKRFNPCRDPEHNPPGMMVYRPGEYEHECPTCHRIVRFTVYPKHIWAEPKKSVTYVDVGNIPPENVASFIERQREVMDDAGCFIPVRK